MFIASASATSSASATASATSSATTTVEIITKSTSDISQEDAYNKAVKKANIEANSLALLNAKQIAINLLSTSNDVIIISALKDEFLNNYDYDKENIKITLISNSPIPTYRVITDNAECIYLTSGVGKTNIASATFYALNTLGAKKIILIGTCASTTEPYKVNTVGLVNKSIYIDANYTALGYTLGQMYGEELFQYSSEDFSNYNYELLVKNSNTNIFNNLTSGTCDQFITNFDLLNKFPKSYNIALVDNEDTSSLQVFNNLKDASNNVNKKICIIRYISDIIESSDEEQKFLDTLKFCSIFFRKYFYDNLAAIKNYQ
jgi:nucleoside phosphorylase